MRRERYLVLFARAPGREAVAKGFAARSGSDLFAAFARGWVRAAAAAGARVVVVTPPEDRLAWRLRLPPGAGVRILSQKGETFGARLADAVRRVVHLGGCTVAVGGDVLPSARLLAKAFDGLDAGAGAVLSPSPDGGVSLLGLTEEDLDLLARVEPRRRDVFERLDAALRGRGRPVLVLRRIPEVDRRRDAADLRRRVRLSASLAGIVDAALERPPEHASPRHRTPLSRLPEPGPRLRAPPAAA